MQMAKEHKVLIRRCDEYDPDKIAAIVTEGMQELGVTPSGNILLKPNVVLAHPEVFPYAFTRKEFLDGVITATKELAKGYAAKISESSISLPCKKIIPLYPRQGVPAFSCPTCQLSIVYGKS
jgi:uncharacterized protein (DUF362 family)